MHRLKPTVAIFFGIVVVFALNWGGNAARAAAVSGTPAAVHGSSAPSAGSMVLTRKIGNVTVLTNARGFTLYSFGPDTPASSKCNGTCAHFWPPLKGPATAGAGVTGKLAAIKRSDGSMQATYNGRPLYTFVGDTRPGQDQGNNLKLNGGIWHVVSASGTTAPAPGASHSTPGGY